MKVSIIFIPGTRRVKGYTRFGGQVCNRQKEAFPRVKGYTIFVGKTRGVKGYTRFDGKIEVCYASMPRPL